MKGQFKTGDRVHYHPIIGRENDGHEYKIAGLGNLWGGGAVAWLEGKAGCVSLKEITLVVFEPTGEGE